MHIKRIKLIDFKRFTDISVEGIPDTAKLVVEGTFEDLWNALPEYLRS